MQASSSLSYILDGGESKSASAIHLALEVVVELPDGIRNPEEELSAHPITAPKCSFAMKWSIDEVVGVEHAVAMQTMPVLCFHPPRRRATSTRLFIARQQLGEGGEHHQMFFFLDVGRGFLLQQRE